MSESKRIRLDEQGRALVEHLGGRWTGRGGMCRCPAHDDRTPSLSIRLGRRRLLLHCFAGCSASDILREVQERGLLGADAGTCLSDPRRSEDQPMRGAARRIWDEARPIRGTLAERYLASRGLESDSSSLRFHSRTPLGSGALKICRPALIAAVRDESGMRGIHRTFINPGGDRAPDAGPKRGLGPFGGGAVRLGGAAPRLGLAEGIETALSVSTLFGIPCWAVLGAERFRLVELPSDVRELLLFLDHDKGGRRAEAFARAAFSHLPSIEAHYPRRRGDDWNDVLRRGSWRTRSRTKGPGGREDREREGG